MMPLLRMSRKLSKADAKMATEPVSTAKKTLVANRATLATMDMLMAR